jgi:leucyl/phenylalanyl-tRNA--protein transferase
MPIIEFPPIEFADEYGLLAAGGDLEPGSLLLAYRSGIFPWPLSGSKRLFWFAPPERAVVYLKDFHESRSLRKTIRKMKFEFTFNETFSEVMRECSSVSNRPREHGTWITEQMIEAYSELHKLGFAHSIECWLEGRLVGGIYGVSIGRMFAAESMFYRESDASKACLSLLCRYLLLEGATFLDCQILNPHLETLGAVTIPRDKFMEELRAALQAPSIDFSTSRLRQCR